MTAQIIYVILFIVALLIAANKHGKTKTEVYNFWTSLVSQLIGLGLLYWGGFFNVFFK